MKLGFNQLNGRYFWIAVVISAVLVGITLYAQHLVTDSAREGYYVIQENTQLKKKVSNVKYRIQQIESNVLEYTTSLDDETKFNTETDLHTLTLELLDLVKFVHVEMSREDEQKLVTQEHSDISTTIHAYEKLAYRQGYAEVDSHVDNLVDVLGELKKDVAQYFEVMGNVRTRFPGMPYLLEYLEPNNNLFSEAVESALQESNMTDAHIKRLDQTQYQIVNLFQAIRYAWVQKVSWLRVMISNRMGAFGEPEISMRRNLVNRQIYADTVEKLFEKLDAFDKKELLGLQQEESLEVMHEASKKYEAHFNKAVSTYFTDNWRADLPMLKNVITPKFDLLRKTVAQIDVIINKNANSGITQTLDTANSLSVFIWIFATSVIMLLMISYFVFKSVIRNPVIEVAEAMEAEAIGNEHRVVNVKSNLHEIQLLDRAFAYMRDQVNSRQQRLEAIFSNAAEGIITIDMSGKVESINEAGLNLFGLTEAASKNKNISDLIHEYNETGLYDFFHGDNAIHHNYEGEIQAANEHKRSASLLVKVSQMQVGAEILYILIVQDVSEQKSLMQDLQHVAEHDALTGLYNRQYYSDSLERIIEVAHRKDSYDIVCMFLDMDNFKFVNDTLGHMAGDRLLKEITELLYNRMRKSDLLARIGGDEFSLVFQGIKIDAAVTLADEYRQCIDEYKFIEEGKTFNVGCSIGLAEMSADIQDKDELLSRADVACHEAKNKGKNCIHVYEALDKEKVDDLYAEMGWSQRIKNAIQNDSFVFARQKICNASDGSVFAEEYLIRMLEDDKKGLIMPAGFLNSAERFGLMPELDKWVVKHALESYALDTTIKGDDKPCISINLSAKSVGYDEIFDAIDENIKAFSIDPAKIIFEITEDVAISDFPNAIRFLNKIRSMGCATALDDFGAGYSSFSYLKEFPVDYVKIDGSFIVGIENNKLNHALVKAMHDVSATLNKKTVVEFVENQQAYDVLKEIGVDYVQGFHISRPELIEKPAYNVVSINKIKKQ